MSALQTRTAEILSGSRRGFGQGAVSEAQELMRQAVDADARVKAAEQKATEACAMFSEARAEMVSACAELKETRAALISSMEEVQTGLRETREQVALMVAAEDEEDEPVPVDRTPEILSAITAMGSRIDSIVIPAPVIVPAAPKPTAWEFQVHRDELGFLKSITAIPRE